MALPIHRLAPETLTVILKIAWKVMAEQMAQEVNQKLDADAAAVGAAAQMPSTGKESAVTEEARKQAAETVNPK